MDKKEKAFIKMQLNAINHLATVGYTDDQMCKILKNTYLAGRKLGYNCAMNEIFTGSPKDDRN